MSLFSQNSGLQLRELGRERLKKRILPCTPMCLYSINPKKPCELRRGANASNSLPFYLHCNEVKSCCFTFCVTIQIFTSSRDSLQGKWIQKTFQGKTTQVRGARRWKWKSNPKLFVSKSHLKKLQEQVLLSSACSDWKE